MRTLEADLRLASEAALPGAYEIGRSAMARDIGQLEMATMHHEALARALQGAAGPASLEEELQRAGDFFTETLSPYDMAYRGFRDAMSALHQLNQTMEREIQRIAHTVHDEAGPLLDAARLAMSAASQAMSPAVQKSLREVSAILDRADEELRRLSHELRPTILDDLGLLPALQFLADRISKAGKVSVEVESDAERARCRPRAAKIAVEDEKDPAHAPRRIAVRDRGAARRGLRLENVATALDLEEGMAYLNQKFKTSN
jgi:signal transduction histidine kinase